MSDIIKLKNSNPLIKYPVDADQLNHNFETLAAQTGSTAIKYAIESTGLVYDDLHEDQLSAAIAQYVMSGGIFNEVGTGSTYILSAREGLSLPHTCTDGMIVTFKATHTNTGASTLALGIETPYPLLTDKKEELKPGTIDTDTYMSCQFRAVYNEATLTTDKWWVVLDSVQSAASSAAGTGGSVAPVNAANVFIKTLIQSAGISYNSEDILQLSRAISSYVNGFVYDAVYADGVYQLHTNEAHFPINHYYNGMTLVFVSPCNNDVPNPAVSLDSLPVSTIYSYSGDDIAAGDIRADQLCILRRKNDKFCLISQFVPSFTMGGNFITGISNDSSLESGSSSNLVTEHAVKSYVNHQLKTTDRNIVSTSYTDASGNAAYLTKVGGHAIELITAEQNEDETNGKCFVDQTPNNPENLIASSNTDLAVNTIANIDDIYWETAKTGFAIDDIKREVSTETGSAQISYITTDENNYGFVFRNNTYGPEYIGFNSLSFLPENVRIKFTDADHTPSSVLFEVKVTGSSVWQPLGDSVWTGEYDDQGERVYTDGFDYGNLSNITPDSDGRYVFTTPKKRLNGDTWEEFNPTTAYAFRIRMFTCETQHPSQSTIEEEGYNPNTDTSGDPKPVQITSMSIGKFVESPIFSANFYDGKTTIKTRPIYYTQYIQNDAEETEVDGETVVQETNGCYLDTVNDGRYLIYLENDSNELKLAPAALLFYTKTQPTPSAATLNGIWINTSDIPYTTSVCIATEILNEDGTPALDANNNPTYSYSWDQIDLILLGECVYSSNIMTSVTTYTSGKQVVDSFVLTNAANSSYTVRHNFGGDVDVIAELECIAANAGYAIGDRVAIAPYMLTTPTLNYDSSIQGQQYTLTNTNSYLTYMSDATTTKVMYGNFKVIHKTNGSFVQIANNQWRMHLYITKD